VCFKFKRLIWMRDDKDDRNGFIDFLKEKKILRQRAAKGL
jgi:hypothetical protein